MSFRVTIVSEFETAKETMEYLKQPVQGTHVSDVVHWVNDDGSSRVIEPAELEEQAANEATAQETPAA